MKSAVRDPDAAGWLAERLASASSAVVYPLQGEVTPEILRTKILLTRARCTFLAHHAASACFEDQQGLLRISLASAAPTYGAISPQHGDTWKNWVEDPRRAPARSND
jgi:hypothetical protein